MFNRSDYSIYLASDGTGETGGRFLAAALHQFDRGASVHVTKFTHLRLESDINRMIQEAEQKRPLILHTIVNEQLRTYLTQEAQDRGIPTMDLLGPLLDSLSHYLNSPAQEVAGRLHKVNDWYFKRMEAIEFTLQHDDGRLPKQLAQADIVLLGVSRTSKTPTSVYLAQEGYRVVNIPIVRSQPLPEKLFDVPNRRIIGLTIDPERLSEIRQVRVARLGASALDARSYTDLEEIEDELRYANKIFSRNKSWLVIDVTNRSIEETAHQILNAVYGRTRPILPT